VHSGEWLGIGPLDINERQSRALLTHSCSLESCQDAKIWSIGWGLLGASGTSPDSLTDLQSDAGLLQWPENKIAFALRRWSVTSLWILLYNGFETYE
jgi:hypothetical protein